MNLERALMIGTGAACVLFWSTVAVERSAYNAWGRVLRTVARPPLLNGLELDLQSLNPRPSTTAGTRALLIVLSDECPISTAQVPAWRSLFTQLAGSSLRRVLIVTKDSTTVADQVVADAVAVGFATELMTISDRAAFREASGISWTPETILLDGARVRLSSETVTPTVAAEIINLVRSVDSPSTGARGLWQQKE